MAAQGSLLWRARAAWASSTCRRPAWEGSTLRRREGPYRRATTLDDLANSRDIPEAVREAARRERPSSLRTLSTVGGCIATAELESELLATFLVHRASVRTADSSGASAVPLGDLLADPDRRANNVITHVEIETGGYAGAARVARTPSDTPIVAAVARRDPEGNVIVAFAGVAETPVLAESTEELVPPGDFRGSSEYRKSMAETPRSKGTGGL